MSKSSRRSAEQPAGATNRRASGPWLAVVVLLVSVSVAYWPSFDGQFVLDDIASIVENPHIRGEGAIVGSLAPPDQDPDAPRWRGPVVAFTLALDHARSGLDPHGYHVTNLVVHLLTTLLVFGCIRRTLRLDGLQERFGAGATGLALAVALLWSLHPLLTESVTYVIQRTTLLMGFFYLATLYLVIRGAVSARARPWYVGAVVCCLLGMLAKESMVTAPVMVLLYDRIFLAPTWAEVWRRRGRLHLALAATWLALAWLISVSPHVGNIGFDLRVGPFEYLLAQTEIIFHYLKLVVWPRDLVLDYGYAKPVTMAAAALPGLLLVALLVVTLAGLRSHPRIAYLGVWFFVTLSPTSSVVPIVQEVGAERRMFLPLIAVVILAVLAGRSLLDLLAARRGLRPTTMRTIAVVMVAAVALALGAATAQRNREYQDPLRLWLDTVARRPDNSRAHNGLGVALVQAGRTEEAVAAYQRAVAIRPGYSEAQYNLGRALARLGRDADAVAAYEQVLRIDPDNHRAHNNLGNALLRLGRPAEAEPHFRDVIRLDPEAPFGYNGLGLCLAQFGHLDEAAEAYRQALRLRPGYAGAAMNLGLVLEAQGDLEGAVEAYRRVLRIDSGHAEARQRLQAIAGAGG